MLVLALCLVLGVKSSCLYSTRRNVELWILCNVLFVRVLYMVRFNHKDIMVKIRCIFQLILAVDFVAIYFTKTYILL